MKVKFVHTNIIARDWRKLTQFYIDVFGCEPVPPERDHHGNWIDRVTGIKDVRIRGAPAPAGVCGRSDFGDIQLQQAA